MISRTGISDIQSRSSCPMAAYLRSITATFSANTFWAVRTGSRSGTQRAEKKSRLLDHDRFFDRLDEVGRLAGGRQFFGLLIGFLLLAVLVQRDPLHRLI